MFEKQHRYHLDIAGQHTSQFRPSERIRICGIGKSSEREESNSRKNWPNSMTARRAVVNAADRPDEKGSTRHSKRRTHGGESRPLQKLNPYLRQDNRSQSLYVFCLRGKKLSHR
ncbi:uncharacterized protein LOC143181030 [Calliopsis andreniformis]|uniref:uncharacterized protein LOC143181030 n=1 Tax=Calliopsis andreniformis TaxID=337506 RepID=UPI003FCEAC25